MAEPSQEYIRTERDKLLSSFHCDRARKLRGSYWTNAITCTRCKYFTGCEKVSAEKRELLRTSEEVIPEGGKLIAKRGKMYLFKKTNGELEPAYSGFDVKKPDWDKLREVDEILFVSKVFVPQMKLVVKPLAKPEAKPEGKNAPSGKRKRKVADT